MVREYSPSCFYHTAMKIILMIMGIGFSLSILKRSMLYKVGKDEKDLVVLMVAIMSLLVTMGALLTSK